MKKICKVDGCETNVHGHGYCKRHYSQMKRHGLIFDRTIYDPNEFIFDGDIVRIILFDKQGIMNGESIIDNESFNIIKGLKWYLRKTYNNKYCISGSTPIYLHRLIMGVSEVDHINHNGLDNRKSNLRLCTHMQNTFNQVIRKSNTSGFKGVHKKRDKWVAQIRGNGGRHYLGNFETKEEAAMAYNMAATELHGEFACLNMVGDTA